MPQLLRLERARIGSFELFETVRMQVSSLELGEVAATSRKYRDRHPYWSGRSGSRTEALQRPIPKRFGFGTTPSVRLEEAAQNVALTEPLRAKRHRKRRYSR